MHSSRMRTARSLTISCSICWGVYLLQGVYLPGGCTCPGVYLLWVEGVYLPGGVLAQEVYLPGGCTCSRECTCQGCTYPGGCTCPRGYLPRGVVPSGGVSTQGGTCPGTPPLCTELLTHATENITLPQTSFAGSNKNAFQ